LVGFRPGEGAGILTAMHITAPPIVTRARQGLPTSLNRRRPIRRAPRGTWAIAAAAMGIVSGAIIVILASR